MKELVQRFLHINFYIFTFLTLVAGATALLANGKTAGVAANICFVFAALLLLGCIIDILIKLNSTLFKR